MIDPPSLVKANAPRDLMVPLPLVLDLQRSGKNRVLYTLSVCSGPSLIVHSVEKSTGFPALDRFIDKQLGIFIVPPRSGCVTEHLVLDVPNTTGFEFN